MFIFAMYLSGEKEPPSLPSSALIPAEKDGDVIFHLGAKNKSLAELGFQGFLVARFSRSITSRLGGRREMERLSINFAACWRVLVSVKRRSNGGSHQERDT